MSMVPLSIYLRKEKFLTLVSLYIEIDIHLFVYLIIYCVPGIWLKKIVPGLIELKF